LLKRIVGDTGFELPPETLEKTESAAARSHFVAHGGQIDPDLQAVIDAWPVLPDVVRADIVAMVRAAE
jgi:hypothetical protein